MRLFAQGLMCFEMTEFDQKYFNPTGMLDGFTKAVAAVHPRQDYDRPNTITILQLG